MDVGRGSPIVGRIYGDLGDSVCEDIRGSIPCAICVLCTWTLLHVSSLYSVIDDRIQVLTSLCHQPLPGRSPDGSTTSWVRNNILLRKIQEGFSRGGSGSSADCAARQVVEGGRAWCGEKDESSQGRAWSGGIGFLYHQLISCGRGEYREDAIRLI